MRKDIYLGNLNDISSDELQDEINSIKLSGNQYSNDAQIEERLNCQLLFRRKFGTQPSNKKYTDEITSDNVHIEVKSTSWLGTKRKDWIEETIRKYEDYGIDKVKLAIVTRNSVGDCSLAWYGEPKEALKPLFNDGWMTSEPLNIWDM